MYQSLICLFLLLLTSMPAKAAESARIVVLAPDLARNLIALGGRDQIVGIIANTELETLLPKASLVGDHQLLSVEQILQLSPDWVLAWQGGNPESQLQRLESLGLNVLRVKTQRLDDLPKQLRLYAKLLNREAEAELMIEQFQTELELLSARASEQPRGVRLFYELWHEPLMSLNDSSWIADIFKLCGATNILGSSFEAYPQISEEAVLAGDTELILGSSELPTNWPEKWQKWPQIPAVSRDQLYTVNADYLHQLTLDTVKGVRQVCEAVEQARNAD